MKFTYEFREQSLYFLCFTLLFQLNSLFDLIFHFILISPYDISFIYFKLIAFFVFLSLELSILAFLFFKNRLFKETQNSLDFFQISLNLALMILYSEFENCQIFETSRTNSWEFGFLISIFIMNSLKFVSNIKYKTICFFVDFIYIASRFYFVWELHELRILMVGFCWIIYYKVRPLVNKNHTFKKKPKNENKSIYFKVLQEGVEEAIGIFDVRKKLLFKNEKLSNTVKNSDDVEKNLSNIRLKFLNITSDIESWQTSNQIIFIKDAVNLKDQDQSFILKFFKSHEEFSLDEIFNELINSFKKDSVKISKEKKTKTLQLSFDIANGDEVLLINEDFHKSKLLLTVFIKSEQIDGFSIQIQRVFNQKEFIDDERKTQNKKIFYVSHEMRTPLNCIVNMLQILKPLISEELGDEFLKPSVVSCNFLLYLVQDLLDMAQIESDKFTINLDEFDIRFLISDILDLFKFQANLKNASVVSKISNAVPEIIISDYRRIRQILINLIGNSLKFLKKLDGKITIDIFVKPKFPTHIIFAVKDNGIGIRDEDKKKLFGAFGKINNDENKKMNSNGVGLGLMISNSLALNLNPTKSSGLTVESEYGLGTTFIFEIEDKGEDTNLREYDSFKYINENLNKFRNNLNEKKFIKKQIESSETISIKNDIIDIFTLKNQTDRDNYRENSERQKKRVTIIENEGSLDKCLHTFANNEFLIKDHFNITMSNLSKSMIKNKQNKRFAPFDGNSVQSFCDKFLGSKDLDEFEVAQTKMALIKELNPAKLCKCPEILICDDNAFNIYSLRKQLEAFNFKIDAANDGEQAIEMVTDYHKKRAKCCGSYHIIFMDIEMPGMNGYESALEIRKIYQGIQKKCEWAIIGCSAHLFEEFPGKHKQYGMNEFASKPIIKERLIVLLSKYFKLKSDYMTILTKNQTYEQIVLNSTDYII